ncbi:MAG: solute carrier family 23 protein [Bacilli bacterium]
MKKDNDLILDVHEKPTIGKWIVLSLQHVFAMFGATILVPILVNQAAGQEVLTIPVTLVASGIGTLLYQYCTKSKSPVYLGSSFAFITPMILGFASAGAGGIFIGTMAVGLMYILIAIIIRFVGTEWLQKLLPPIIIGPMIMIIGLGLAPTAINSIGISSGSKIVWENVLVALITFLTTSIIATRGKGFLKVIPFLIGISVGYISSCFLGLVDFNPIKEAAFLSIPNFQIPFIDYKIDFAALSIMIPIVLVTVSEHIGDHTVLGQIIGKNLIKDPGLDRTLLGDGVATFVAGFIGGPANTTYGENTSVVGMSKIASIYVLRLAAIFAIILGFLGKFTALVSTIPNAVLGGVSLLLYGFIAVNGLKVLVENKTDFSINKNVIVSASMLVIGLGGAAISFKMGNVSMSISGMALSAIVGIILNLFLKEEK